MAKHESKIEREAKAEHESVAEERKEHERRARGGLVERDESRPEDAHGGSVRRPRRARGGLTKTEAVHAYNAVGAPEEREAEDEKEEFARGGHAKRKAGGLAEGGAARERGDRAPRGRRRAGGMVRHEQDGDGAAVHHHGDGPGVHHHGDGDIHLKRGGEARPHRAAGGRAGGSPLSSGSRINPPKDDRDGRGYEGIKPGAEPF